MEFNLHFDTLLRPKNILINFLCFETKCSVGGLGGMKVNKLSG